jgi:two-component system OmpR family sensor kinase
VDIANPPEELGRLAAVLNSTFAGLESAMARQRRFTADAAHELRTPLSALIADTQSTLARDRTAAEYRRTVEADLETAQQMRRLTESLLELARLDDSSDQTKRRSTDLAATVRSSVEQLNPLATDGGVSVVESLEEATVFCVPERLDLLVSNLLNNALIYNKQGGEVRLATFCDNDWAVLRVADTGVGIAPEDLPHIFERFYRADKIRLRSEGHAGLGLAISKAIINAEGGSIEVQSTPDVGTTFTVRLPGNAKTTSTARS